MKLIFNILYLLILNLVNSPIWAQNNLLGFVSEVKGHAWLKGKIKTEYIKAKDNIYFDKTIKTEEMSSVTIIFENYDKLVVGPKTTLKVYFSKKDKINSIKLIKGTIRYVSNSPQIDLTKVTTKFLTEELIAFSKESASFILIRNSKVSLSSILTIMGTVLVAKSSPSGKYFKLCEGEFVQNNLKNYHLIKPTSISPKQFERLLKNNNLKIYNSIKNYKKIFYFVPPEVITKKFSTITPQLDHHFNYKKEDQLKEFNFPSEGYFDVKTKEYNPPSGGYLDLKTAFYIFPHDGSEYDPIIESYTTPSSMGLVDKFGHYYPPSGHGLNFDGKFHITNSVAIIKDEIPIYKDIAYQNIIIDNEIGYYQNSDQSFKLYQMIKDDERISYRLRDIHRNSFLKINFLGNDYDDLEDMKKRNIE